MENKAYEVNLVLIRPEDRSEVVFSLAHYKEGTLCVLVASQQQKVFFSTVVDNYNHKNMVFLTI